MISHPLGHSAISHINLIFSQTRAIARFLYLGGGGRGKGQCLTQKCCPIHVAARKKFFRPSGGLRWHAPWKMFKVKGPRLAKNAFPEISAWKN